MNNKKRSVRDIYRSAKKRWKRDKKQINMEFYLREEIRNEIRGDKDREYELKACCNQLSDVSDVEICIALLSVVVGSLVELKMVMGCLLLLAMVAVWFPIPYKKCLFVLDNLESNEED